MTAMAPISIPPACNHRSQGSSKLATDRVENRSFFVHEKRKKKREITVPDGKIAEFHVVIFLGPEMENHTNES